MAVNEYKVPEFMRLRAKRRKTVKVFFCDYCSCLQKMMRLDKEQEVWACLICGHSHVKPSPTVKV